MDEHAPPTTPITTPLRRPTKESLTPEVVRTRIKYCNSTGIGSPVLAAYSCLYESENRQDDESEVKPFWKKMASFIFNLFEHLHQFVQFFTELPLLTLSFAALQAATRWKDSSSIVYHILWGVSKFFQVLYFLTRVVVSPGKSFEEALKKSRVLACFSLLITLVAWTAIAGPLSIPISLFAALPAVSVVMTPIASALGTAAGFISPFIPKIFPQVNTASRFICSAALGVVLTIKNTFQWLFSSKKQPQDLGDEDEDEEHSVHGRLFDTSSDLSSVSEQLEQSTILGNVSFVNSLVNQNNSGLPSSFISPIKRERGSSDDSVDEYYNLLSGLGCNN